MPAPSSLSSSSRSMNDLPVELKNTIVKLCAEQDERFSEWAVTQTGTTAAELKRKDRTHGRSISMLFQVDRQFCLLTAPFLFKVRLPSLLHLTASFTVFSQVLKSSKIDLRFKCCVAPARLNLFKILELDGRSTDILPYLPCLQRVEKLVLFKTGLEIFGYRPITPFANATLGGAAGSTMPATYAAIGLRALKNISTISSQCVDTDSLSPFIQNSSASLRTLELNVSQPVSPYSLGRGLSQATNLESLSLISTNDSLYDRVFDLSSVQHSLTSTPSLQSLTITAHFLHSSHFPFAALFSSTLLQLELNATYAFGDEDGLLSQPQPGTNVFPLVTTLSITGHDDLLFDTIASIDANKHFPSLAHLELKLLGVIEWYPDESPLSPFRSALHLETLKIPNFAELPAFPRRDIKAFCSELGVVLEQGPTGPDAFPSTPDAIWRAGSSTSNANGIRKTLEYIGKEIEKAQEQEDNAMLRRIQGFLKVLEVERVAGEVWEMA
jgi:hypothetical protein